ncbi:hypothetical protein WNY61_09315 [Sulfitobacter sp. AS92]|uniref:hypothetical protein n=1 Tax=Sulfitobacter sp. AS92 TaxID=3135783 RepID=UPI00316CF9EA
MTRNVLIADKEYATGEVFSGIGRAARDHADAVTAGAIAFPSHWSRFTVTIAGGGQSITIAPGELWKGDAIYSLEAAVDIGILDYLPPAGNEKWIAILAQPSNQTTRDRAAKVRTGLDPENPQPATQSVVGEEVRLVEFVVQQGTQAAPGSAVKPTVPESSCAVVFILLSGAGAQAIEPAVSGKVKSLYDIDGRLTGLEVRVDALFQRVTGIETDVAAIKGEIPHIIRPEIIIQLQGGLARMEQLLGAPVNYVSRFFDAALTTEHWDESHVDWNADIGEGVKFPKFALTDNRMEVLADASPDIRIKDGVLMPAWTEERLIDVSGSGSTKDISQQTHTVRTAHTGSVSRSSVEYGPTVKICENTREYANVGQAAYLGNFKSSAGETFQNLGKTDNPWNQTQEAANGHSEYRARQVIKRSWTETYTYWTTTTYGVNGSVYGQTFLNSQERIVTSLELDVARKGSDGDIHVFLCEVNEGGTPDFDTTIVKGTIAHADLSTGWVKCDFRPTLLTAGRRYAWFTVTTGNHSLRTVTGNKYAQGSLFWSTDEAWAQGSPTEDFAFRLNAAKFSTTRLAVEFVALTLQGGMTEFHFTYGGWEPGGTRLPWEYAPKRIGLPDVWHPFSTDDNSPLRDVPDTCRIRAVFEGTTDLMPSIVLDDTARHRAYRRGASMLAVGEDHGFGLPTTTVITETVVDDYDPAIHTVTPELMVGGTVYSADTVTEIEDDYPEPERLKLRASFTVPSTNSARYRLVGQSTSSVDLFFGESVAMFAF